MVDLTYEKIIRPSLTRLQRKPLTGDMMEYKPDREYDRIVIVGAGASLDQATKDHFFKKGDLIFTNQGSFNNLQKNGVKADVYECVDPQAIAMEPYDALKIDAPTLIASTTIYLPYTMTNSFYFKNNIYNPDKNEELNFYNNVVKLFDPEIKTFQLQVGSVVNSTFLTINFLIENGNLKNVPIVFVGADLGQYKELWRCKQYKRAPWEFCWSEVPFDYPKAEEIVEDAYGLTTVQLQAYYVQLTLILNQIKRKVFTAYPGRLETLMPLWGTE